MNRTNLLLLGLAGALAAGCSNHVAQAAGNVAPNDLNTPAPFATPPPE
jgi:hypothetical protein